MSYEQNEPYKVIGLGNAYDYVIKNMTEPETYGTFQGDKESMKTFVEKVNRIVKEKEQLKQQLLYDGDSVCDICKHEYLTPSGDYFISNCRKGHEECSKEDLRYCKDFEVKELKE